MLKKVRKYLKVLAVTTRGKVEVAGKPYSVTGFSFNQILKPLMSGKSHEAELDEVIQRALAHKEGAFFDVGANIGQTLVKLLRLEPDRQYVGFEPQLSCCSSISRFITENNLARHTILPVGLADKTGIAKLGTRAENDRSASIVDEYRPKGFHTTYNYIPVVKGDDITEQVELDAVAFVKIDVEGAELEVLNGLSKTLEQFRPFLLFEVLPHYLLITNKTLDPETRAIRDARNDKIDQFIRSFDYKLIRIESNGKMTEASELKADERKNQNFLAVPQESAQVFLGGDPGGAP